MTEPQEEPSGTELLFMWSIAAEGGEAWLADIKPKREKKDRQSIIKAGWVMEKSPGGRKIRVELTETGWDMLRHRMIKPIQSRSTAGAEVLGKILRELANLLKRRNLDLTEVFDHNADEKPATPTECAPASPIPTPASPSPGARIDADVVLARIRDCAPRIAVPGGGVTLVALRQELSDLERGQLDRALIELQQSSRISLMPFDDPQQIREAERHAALSLSGRSFHILYLQ